MGAGVMMGIRDLQKMLGISRQAIYSQIRKGRLPPPVNPLGGRASWWNREQVELVIRSRKPAIRLLAETAGAAPILEGVDAALVGVTDLGGEPVTVYDHHLVCDILRRRGMADPGQFIEDLGDSGPLFVRRRA